MRRLGLALLSLLVVGALATWGMRRSPPPHLFGDEGPPPPAGPLVAERPPPPPPTMPARGPFDDAPAPTGDAWRALLHQQWLGTYSSRIEKLVRPAVRITTTKVELDRLSQRIAAWCDAVCGNEQRVAVHGARTVLAYAAILGVLRSGRAYVPLHPDHPPLRWRSMLTRAARVLAP